MKEDKKTQFELEQQLNEQNSRIEALEITIELYEDRLSFNRKLCSELDNRIKFLEEVHGLAPTPIIKLNPKKKEGSRTTPKKDFLDSS